MFAHVSHCCVTVKRLPPLTREGGTCNVSVRLSIGSLPETTNQKLQRHVTCGLSPDSNKDKCLCLIPRSATNLQKSSFRHIFHPLASEIYESSALDLRCTSFRHIFPSRSQENVCLTSFSRHGRSMWSYFLSVSPRENIFNFAYALISIFSLQRSVLENTAQPVQVNSRILSVDIVLPAQNLVSVSLYSPIYQFGFPVLITFWCIQKHTFTGSTNYTQCIPEKLMT